MELLLNRSADSSYDLLDRVSQFLPSVGIRFCSGVSTTQNQLDIIVVSDDDVFMRYPGGKGKTYQHVINVMPPHRVYIESHLGGGAVMRNKKPTARNIGIEADPNVVSTWPIQKAPYMEIIQGRAEDFLTQYKFRGDELVYADPPYHPHTRRQTRVYSKDYSVEDHERLLAILASLPCMVVLSGYANDLYNTALKSWRTRTFQAKTHTELKEETLWFNFDPPKVLHDSRYLGDDFRARQATKRRSQRLREKVSRMDPIERAAFSQWLNETYPFGCRRNTQ